MYVNKYFDSKSKQSVITMIFIYCCFISFNVQLKIIKATEMIANIQKEFKLILNEVDWMDSASKKKALEKVFLKLID